MSLVWIYKGLFAHVCANQVPPNLWPSSLSSHPGRAPETRLLQTVKTIPKQYKVYVVYKGFNPMDSKPCTWIRFLGGNLSLVYGAVTWLHDVAWPWMPDPCRKRSRTDRNQIPQTFRASWSSSAVNQVPETRILQTVRAMKHYYKVQLTCKSFKPLDCIHRTCTTFSHRGHPLSANLEHNVTKSIQK